jgi:hypothetical protein
VADEQNSPAPFGLRNQLVALGRRRRERFLAENVLVGFESCERERVM